MRALVTGGAGFIGSHLVEALVKRRAAVRVLDNLSSGKLHNLSAVSRKIQFVRGDIRNPKTLRLSLRGVDVVFHQAALRSVPESVKRPLEYHEVNVTGILLLLDACLQAGVRRVVYASSSSVYGNVPLPQKESVAPRPMSPYAATKLVGEAYCSTATRLHGLETVGLRYFNVFGPRQSLEDEYAVVIPKFITSLLMRKRPPIYGDGKQTRDFTYVGNVVEANLKAARAARASGEVFNIATCRPHTVNDLAKRLSRMMGVQLSPKHFPRRKGDIPHSWADISKAKRLLGYRAAVPFEEGLRKTVAWFDANRGHWQKG